LPFRPLPLAQQINHEGNNQTQNQRQANPGDAQSENELPTPSVFRLDPKGHSPYPLTFVRGAFEAFHRLPADLFCRSTGNWTDYITEPLRAAKFAGPAGATKTPRIPQISRICREIPDPIL
jgi:hypothetical protein